ncbi:hypothetical protein MAR_007351, partial [Mya arenaria]
MSQQDEYSLDRILSGLRCWKCIAHDCDLDPEDNYKATKVDCKGGNQQCMKVQFRMFDNVTHYDSVIRTCTDRPCHVTIMDDLFKCVATPKEYMIGGCTLRTCCSDRDYCNGATTTGKKLWPLNGALMFISISSYFTPIWYS